MIDSTRFDSLLIYRKLKEKIREWWRLEIAYADATGFVVDHKVKGAVVPPDSLFCAASLGCKSGFGQCNKAVADAVKGLIGTRTIKAQLVDECHMGLQLIVCPIICSGRFEGALFACGFMTEAAKATRKEQVLASASAAGLKVHNPSDAYDALPALSALEMEYLKDMLETAASEIAAYWTSFEPHESGPISAHEGAGVRGPAQRFGDIVGRSPAMLRLFSLMDRIVTSDTTVLVTGENGTGKELIARALHYHGPRKAKPFVAQNCSAMNDNLLESELFGHVRGSFTGAVRDKDGLFRVADGGTFFLDEVADMSPAMQVKLLRVIQEGTFTPVGGTKPEHVDVRIIAATNRNLKAAVERRMFREDLYYRLNVINIEVPPLRDRREDIPLICEHFLKMHAEDTHRPVKRLAGQVLSRFLDRPWPGNVRELENEIERLVVLAGDDTEIRTESWNSGQPSGESPAWTRVDVTRHAGKGDLGDAVASLEREMIQSGLVATHWNKTKLAAQLGVSRTTLIKKIRDYGIEDKE